MDLPKFLLADNSNFDDAFVLHTEYPRFLLNVNSDDIEWFDEVDSDGDDVDVENQVKDLMESAYEFFENEISAYEDEDFEEE